MAFQISDKCTACGNCTAECPSDAILDGKPYKIDANECTDCGACADVCPADAISQV